MQLKLAPASLEIWHQGRCVARHARSYERHREILDLEHYLCVDFAGYLVAAAYNLVRLARLPALATAA